jgi:hypothetical protein
MSNGAATATMALLNAAAWPLAAWLFVDTTARLSGTPLTRRERMLDAAMLLCWASVRSSIVKGQTTALALVLLLAFVRTLDRKPIRAGLAFGLAAYKINLALAFSFLFVTKRAWRAAAAAALTAVGLTAVYAATVRDSFLGIFRDYWHDLDELYLAHGHELGWTDSRWIVERLVADERLSAVLYGVYAIGTLALAIVAIVRMRRVPPDRRTAFVLASGLAWSLAALYNQRFNMILFAPTVLLLMWDRAGLLLRASTRAWLAAAFLAVEVADAPLLIRLVLQSTRGLSASDAALVASVLTRTLTALLFAVVLTDGWAHATRPAPAAVVSAGAGSGS